MKILCNTPNFILGMSCLLCVFVILFIIIVNNNIIIIIIIIIIVLCNDSTFNWRWLKCNTGIRQKFLEVSETLFGGTVLDFFKMWYYSSFEN